MTIYIYYSLIIFMVYIINFIPFALLICGSKIHDGSGNCGATNACRVSGKKAGMIVAILDISKALISLLFAEFLYKNYIILDASAIYLINNNIYLHSAYNFLGEWSNYVSTLVLIAVSAHIMPLSIIKKPAGAGVAVFIGCMLYFDIFIGLIMIIFHLSLYKFFESWVRSIIICSFGFILGILIFDWNIYIILLTYVLIIFRHKKYIQI